MAQTGPDGPGGRETGRKGGQSRGGGGDPAGPRAGHPQVTATVQAHPDRPWGAAGSAALKVTSRKRCVSGADLLQENIGVTHR